MTPDRAKFLSEAMRQLAKKVTDGHMEPIDLVMVASALAEVLAHIAAREEARARVSRKK